MHSAKSKIVTGRHKCFQHYQQSYQHLESYAQCNLKFSYINKTVC